MKFINVLGTDYSIQYKSIDEDGRLSELEGYVDTYRKKIIIAKIEEREYFKDEPIEKLNKIKSKVVRHEITHAFLFESGLDCNSRGVGAWAENEEMVDWFAMQSPKIYKIFEELDILE